LFVVVVVVNVVDVVVDVVDGADDVRRAVLFNDVSDLRF